MPIESPRFPFNPGEIGSAPEEEGVYVLWQGRELIYVGRAVGRFLTLRRCLSDHCSGTFGPCTQNATHYGWELSKVAVSREAELRDEFVEEFGRRPRCQ
jgi:hypothetical protein